MKQLIKHLILFMVGGIFYIAVEMIWRKLMGSHPTHWSMFVLGGICFLCVGLINEFLSWNTSIWKQCAIGTMIILILEFIFGCILNLWLGLDVWNYSNLPFNILGQVCLQFAVAWYLLSSLAIFLDDWLRYWLFKEEKPHYNWSFREHKNE